MSIDPKIDLPKLPESRETAKDLLAAGNYAQAFHKSIDPETTSCAKIMCGAVSSGLDGLAHLAVLSEDASLIQAYGHWCLGELAKALEITKSLKGEAAAKLAAFIRDGTEVLVCSTQGAAEVESFENINIIYQTVTPEIFGDSALDRSPDRDLIISFGTHGAFLPSNIFELGCPTVFWVADHDYFYATRQPDYAQATVLVANSAAEHLELSEHYPARVASFPGHETYGKSDEFPAVTDSKQYDIGYTGRAFVPYMRDKAQFLYRLAMLDHPDLAITIRDGYLSEDDFMSVMRESKFVPLFWRYAGGIQTRGIDALRQRAFLFSPEPLTAGELIGGDAGGFVSIHGDRPDELAAGQLKNYEDRSKAYAEQETEFADEFSDLFWPQPQRDQRFIKFCLFQSIIAVDPEPREKTQLLLPAELRGYSPEEAVRVYASVAKFNMAAEDKTAAHYNFAANAAFYAATVGSGNEELAHYALDIYALGLAAYPENRVLKFNAARVLWTFGAKPEASVLFGELARSDDALMFDPKEALLSHRMRHLADMFSYGDYLQAALNDPASAKVMIQSGALTYLGVLAFETDQAAEAQAFFEKAVALSPINFPAFRWLTEVLTHLEADTDKVLSAFYQAINLYPPLLCALLPFGVTAELAKDDVKKAASLLNQWVLYHLRVRQPSGEALPMEADARATVQEHSALLKDWTREAFDVMQQDAAH